MPQSFTFVADSTSTTLIFTDVSPTTASVDLLLDNVRVSLSSAPAITGQPQSQTVTAGSSATFSVVASGQALAYQWRFNGGNIAGATSSSYTIAIVQSGNAGNYDVVVSNGSGTVTSAVAVLTVSSGTPGNLANGSFESGYTGWTAAGNQEISTDASVGGTAGSAFVWFNAGQRTPNGVLSQIFATTAGQGYLLALDVGAFSLVNLNEQRLKVALTGNSLLASQTLSVFAPGNGARYVAKSVSFVADSASTTLTLTDVSPTTDSVDLLLDNVRLSLSSSRGRRLPRSRRARRSAPGAAPRLTSWPAARTWRINGGLTAAILPGPPPAAIRSPMCRAATRAITMSSFPMAPEASPALWPS